jgi:hypothetical protein
MPGIPALEGLRQEDHNFQASLGYIVMRSVEGREGGRERRRREGRKKEGRKEGKEGRQGGREEDKLILRFTGMNKGP